MTIELEVQDTQGQVHVHSCEEGTNLLQVLQQAGYTIIAPCGGKGICKNCMVMVAQGTEVGFKLACLTDVEPNMRVFLQEDTMIVEGADEGSGNAIPEDARLGLAVDIGSTTMVFYLVNLDTGDILATVGRTNPQVVFGGDVISRITASANDDDRETLCSLLGKAFDGALKTFGIDSARIEKSVVVGNTTMEHFATGLDARGLGVAPFTPVSLFGEYREVYGSKRMPHQAYFGPSVATYVGADITAGMYVAGIPESEKPLLFVDIGTNGEMALGNSSRMLCCATAAGPAFEGAVISCGMPAMPGAISTVAQAGDDITIQTIEDRPAIGICGSGLLDAVAVLVEMEVIEENGAFADEDDMSEAMAARMIEIDDMPACRLDDDGKVFLTQRDVREIQMAKAALRAGIETMLDEFGVSASETAGLVLAGGFGKNMNPQSAAAIGMIPPEVLSNTTAIGNAAGKGAVKMLDEDCRKAVEELCAKTEYLELSGSAIFNSYYVDEMSF